METAGDGRQREIMLEMSAKMRLRVASGSSAHVEKMAAISGGSLATRSAAVPPVSCISPVRAHGGIRKPLPHTAFAWQDAHVANVNVVSSSLIARCRKPL